MWKHGSTPNATSLAPTAGGPSGGAVASTWRRFVIRLPWVSMAALGWPAVPDVKMSTARSVGSRSTIGTGSAASRTSRWMPSVGSNPAPMTWRIEGIVERSIESNEVAPGGPDDHARPDRSSAISRSNAFAGLWGLSGTTTRPAPSAAR